MERLAENTIAAPIRKPFGIIFNNGAPRGTFVSVIDQLFPLHCAFLWDVRLYGRRHPTFPHCGRNKVERRGGLRRSFRGYLSEGQLNERAEGRLSLMASTYPRDNLPCRRWPATRWEKARDSFAPDAPT